KDQVYRIAVWVRAQPGVKVELQVSDNNLDPRDGLPVNYGGALFDPSARTVLQPSGRLKGEGIGQGPEEWQKIWVDLAPAGGEFVVAFGLFAKDGSSFKGDGRLGVSFGGIEVTERN